jgi:glycosyltransferase involved in cell wall biosynthesis
MRILEVVDLFSPSHGGSAVVPYQLSRQLSKNGHKVTIYASKTRLTQTYINLLPEVRVHAFNTWLSLANFQVTPGLIGKARNEVKHFDIIHMHNYRTFQNVVVHHYAKKYGVPYVLQAHGSLTTFFQRGWLKRVFDTAWGYRILKDAAKVLAVTKAEAEQYQSMKVSEGKIELVPHGVDLSEYENLPEKGEFRRRYNLGNDQRIILYLGRIDKIKGLDLLAGAFADLARLRDDIKLIIAGPDGGYLRTLRRLVSDLRIGDTVVFTGPLYGLEKLKAYVDADVYVLPSSYEIFGITVLEACACGTPVAITDRCGIAEAIKGQAGLVVSYDKDQLKEELVHMLSDDRVRHESGERGRLLVCEKFNWQKIVEQVERVYEAAKHR